MRKNISSIVFNKGVIILLSCVFCSIAQANLVRFLCPTPQSLVYSPFSEDYFAVSGVIQDINNTGNEFELFGKTKYQQTEKLTHVHWRRDYLTCSYAVSSKGDQNKGVLNLLSDAAHTPILSRCRFAGMAYGVSDCDAMADRCELICEVL